MRARYYDPATGRFISRDPMASLPGWGGSAYGYAAVNPVHFTDPSGLAVVWSEAHQKWMDDANGALWTEATGWYDPKNGASWTATSGWVDPNSGMVWVNGAAETSRVQCAGSAQRHATRAGRERRGHPRAVRSAAARV
ncbi:MAG: RHS repeat-associated core domain-containing protein [Dehalococcoidia bacterium]